METQNCGLPSDFDMQPRVYARKLGGEYIEIAGVKSFERSDAEGSGGEISFVMADGQDDALKNIFLDGSDKYVDIRMEFSIGMVMKFSGYVENISGNTLCIAVSTPIVTDIVESADPTVH